MSDDYADHLEPLAVHRGHLADLEPDPGAPEPQEPPVPAEQPGHSWQDEDLTEVIHEVASRTYLRPEPTIITVENGKGLLYPGRVHGVHGIGGAGKTWLCALALGQCIDAGEHCVFVDLEDTPATLIERLVIDLQCDPDQVARLLHYKRPSEPSSVGIAEVHATVRAHHPTVVVLDSVGEGLAAEGVKQNEDHEVATWMARVARSVANLGPAVLLVDHVPKSDETTLMPIGSQRKQAAMNGVVYSAQVKVPFSRETTGMAVIVCGKDRLGAYKRGEVVAEMHVTPRGDGSSLVELRSHEASQNDDGTFRPTIYMESVSRYLEKSPRSSTSQIRKGVTGKNDLIDNAVAVLVREGFVEVEHGPRNSNLHTCVKRFRQAEDRGAGSQASNDRDPAPALGRGRGAGSLSLPQGRVGQGGAGCDLPLACRVCGEPLHRLDVTEGATRHASCGEVAS